MYIAFKKNAVNIHAPTTSTNGLGANAWAPVKNQGWSHLVSLMSTHPKICQIGN